MVRSRIGRLSMLIRAQYTEVRVGLGNCNCLTRTRLLCQKERGLKKRDRVKVNVRVRVRGLHKRHAFCSCVACLSRGFGLR